MNLSTPTLSISIQPGHNKPFTSHETINQFYAKTTREEPLNGKRHLETYLASGEEVVGKVGRPKGSTKAARAAADTSVGRGRGAGPAERGGGALASSSIAGRGKPGGRGHGAGGGGAGADGSSVAASAGSSAPDDGGSYDASSSACASVGRGRGAVPALPGRRSRAQACGPALRLLSTASSPRLLLRCREEGIRCCRPWSV